MNRLGEAIFKRMFRIDRATFDVVLSGMESDFTINATKAGNSSGEPISLMTRLAVSLRWLAGGSYLDLCFAWGTLDNSVKSTLYVRPPTDARTLCEK
jgi:hypothetical protein